MRDVDEQPLSREDRLRRVGILCCSFWRNVTLYRALQNDIDALRLCTEPNPNQEFWTQIHSNFFDIAVIEWCKLFGNKKDTPASRLEKHHWRRIVEDESPFRQSLFTELAIDENDFEDIVDQMRTHRDKFAAHLDNDKTIYPPNFDIPSKAVKALCKYVYAEVSRDCLNWRGLPSANKIDEIEADLRRRAANLYNENIKLMPKI